MRHIKKTFIKELDEGVRVIQLSDLTEGSFLHRIASMKIKYDGVYRCLLEGEKTRIIK